MTAQTKRASTTGMTLRERFQGALKRKRAGAGLTQVQLANRAMLSVSYISMLERGERSPPLETIEALADVLAAEPIDLLR